MSPLSQGVVLQQDTYIEDQKLALSERALSRSFFRPTSLLEQEKQRNLEKQRQELANLKKQQTQHQEERRRREKEWEVREKELAEHEAEVVQREEQVQRLRQELEREREELQVKKAAYQLDLERLRTAQKQLEREKVQLKQDVERFTQMRQEPDHNQVNYVNGQAPGEADPCRELPPSSSSQGTQLVPAQPLTWGLVFKTYNVHYMMCNAALFAPLELLRHSQCWCFMVYWGCLASAGQPELCPLPSLCRGDGREEVAGSQGRCPRHSQGVDTA